MKRVLIADDNRIALEGMKRVIDWKGYDCELVAFCMDGETAWEIIEQGDIDIVISDIEMPKLNGIQLLQRINENKLDTKLIFMSCYEDFDFVKSAIDMDAIAYVLKPVIPENLEKALTKIMNIYKKDDTLIESQNRLESLIENHLSILQEHFFRSLLFNSQMPEEEILQRLKNLHIDLKIPYNLQVAIVQCLNKSDNDECVLNLIDMRELVGSLEVNATLMQAYLDGNDNLFVVSIYPPGETDSINNAYIQFSDYAIDNNIKLKIGISNESDNIAEFNVLYSQAKQAISSSFISDKNMIILYNDIFSDSECFLDFIDPTILKQELSDILFEQDEENINKFLNKYIPVNTDKMHEYYIRYFCYSTINIIEMLLASFNTDYNEVINHSIIWDKLAHYESITDVKQWLHNVLKSTLEVLYKKPPKKDIELIDKIKKIIEQEYASHLTLNIIAERVFFSSIHINNLFKKETGLTISEYLIKYRIDMAKKLLQTSDNKIYAVAQAVGYRNQAYFKLLFKQTTGYTPIEYKNLFADEEKNNKHNLKNNADDETE